MAHIEFIEKVHSATKRNYLERVVAHDKAECATISKMFGQEYWDGDRKYGYGGHSYDGRWRPVAEKMAEYYGLGPSDKVLDVGCGKGYLLYELTQVVPGIEVAGLDISQYAVENAKEEIKPYLRVGHARDLPYEEGAFDLVISINALHNLYVFDLRKALQELQRVGKGRGYVVVDSYRTEAEKANLLHWQLTCECFYTPKEWEWLYGEAGYTGDYGYVFYE